MLAVLLPCSKSPPHLCRYGFIYKVCHLYKREKLYPQSRSGFVIFQGHYPTWRWTRCADMVADMAANKKIGQQVGGVADMEVDKVADKVVDMMADKKKWPAWS